MYIPTSVPSSPDVLHTFPPLCLPWMALPSLLCFPRSSPSSSWQLRFSNPEEKPSDSGLTQEAFGFPAQEVQKYTFQGWFSWAKIHWRPRTFPPPIPSCFAHSFCPLGCKMAIPPLTITWASVKWAKANLWGYVSLPGSPALFILLARNMQHCYPSCKGTNIFLEFDQ